MTRGHMKMQAKAKNLKKQEALKKSIGHDQKGACLKSLIYKCTVCMVRYFGVEVFGNCTRLLHYFKELLSGNIL